MTLSPSDRLPTDPNTASPDIIYPPTDEGTVQFAYDRNNLDALLRAYAFSEPLSEDTGGLVTQDDVDEAIAGYATTISPHAISDGEPNIPLLRRATDALVAGMDRVANQKFGFKPPKSKWHWILIQARVEDPEMKKYYAGLDDRYWEIQFPEEFSEQRLVKRKEGEDDAQYLARHIHCAWHGLIFSHFSFIPDQTHSSTHSMRLIAGGMSKGRRV